MDNPITHHLCGCPRWRRHSYKGLGIGYGDGVVDNERYGMRAFIYYNGGADSGQGDPTEGVITTTTCKRNWLDGAPACSMVGAGTTATGCQRPTSPPTTCSPGTAIPWAGHGRCGAAALRWQESAGNFPIIADVPSAGPFTLEPGAFNNITVGVVWARASSGGPFASVQCCGKRMTKHKRSSTTASKLLDGPDAPQLTMQELDRRMILYLRNPSGNNVGEGYHQVDPIIPDSELWVRIFSCRCYTDREYRFQGYKCSK